MSVAFKKSVLFLCTHNSARSQMAEGLLRAYHGDRYEAFSAGTEASYLKPIAVEVMAEIGIDISGHTSKNADSFFDADIDFVVTLCDSAREHCPTFPAARHHMHHAFPDPSLHPTDGSESEQSRRRAFRRTRDEIKLWLDETFA